MKKSFDYFKTLKDMSLSVGNAYSAALHGSDFNKDLICFSGLKFELSDRLINEFVAPIERNDIYNLSYRLNEEMYYINKLSNSISLVDCKNLTFTDSFESGFHKQAEMFDLFARNKSYDKALKYINESKAFLNGLNTSMVLYVKKCLSGIEQPLLQYVVVCCFSDLFKSLEKTFYEVERVIINNN